MLKLLRKDKEKSNLTTNKFTVFILYILVLCLGVLSVFTFVRGIKNKKEYDFIYTEKNNIDYQVYLKENEFFEEPYLPSGGKYIASLIDSINIDFNYELQSQDKIKGDYKYYITANIEAKEKDKNVVIWNKEEKLYESDTSQIEDVTDYSFATQVKINYSKYNNIINEFRSAYGVSLDGFLVVTLHVESNIDHPKSAEVMPVSYESSISIPLLEQTVDIELDYNPSNTKINNLIYRGKGYFNYILIFSGMILFGFYLYYSSKLVPVIIKVIKNQDKYRNKIKSIFNNYDQIIVKVNTFPNLNNKTVMTVETFDELLDAQSGLNEPILYNEVKDRKESYFIVIKDDRVFKYVIKEKDYTN